MVFARETAIRLLSTPIFVNTAPQPLSYAPFSLIPVRIVIPVLICLDFCDTTSSSAPLFWGDGTLVNQLAMIFKRPSENIGIGRYLFSGRCVDPFQYVVIVTPC